MKVLIIGTNHAGIAAANTLLDNYPGNEIVMKHLRKKVPESALKQL